MLKTIILLIAIYILNMIDYWQTVYAIELFGIEVEANPIAQFLFENNCAWAVKFIAVPVVLALIGILVRADKRMRWALYLLLAVFIGVVINNFIVILYMSAVEITVLQ